MRVASDRTARCSMGGWLHRIDGDKPLRPLPAYRPPQTTKPIHAASIMAKFESETWPEMTRQHAEQLGVKPSALESLGASWAPEYNAWAWPMRSAIGEVVGIRLRNNERKWAVTGSKAGLFYVNGEARRCYVVEGPTDCAAGLSIGVDTIGRPSNMGLEKEIVKLLGRKKCREVVIVADNDDDKTAPDGRTFNPGMDGSIRLAKAMTLPHMIITLPVKDLRCFVKGGGGRALLETLVDAQCWQRQSTGLGASAK